MKVNSISIPLILSTLFLSACGSGSLLLRARVQDAAAAKGREVAVVPDLTMKNEAAAKRLAALTKEKLQAGGYKIASSVESSELVVVAFAARENREENAVGGPVSEPGPMPLSYGNASPGTIGDRFSLLDESSKTSSQPEFVLTVMAYPKAAWLSSAKEIQPAWSVVTKGSPFSKPSGSFVEQMLQVSAPYFGKDTGSKPLQITLP